MKTIAFVAVCHGAKFGKFGIGAAEQDLPGYWPIPGHGVFETYDEARKKADELNAQLGLTPDAAAAVVCSSMRKQNTKRRTR